MPLLIKMTITYSTNHMGSVKQGMIHRDAVSSSAKVQWIGTADICGVPLPILE